MFTCLHVHNYRSIGPRPLDLDLAPITVLVGANGSGKSSIMEALALTAQSAVEDPGRRDLVLAGERVQIPQPASVDYRDVFRPIYFKGDLALPLSVGFGWQPRQSFFDSETAKAALSLEVAAGREIPSRASIGYRWVRRGRYFPEFEHHFTVAGHPFLDFGFKAEHEGPHGASLRYSVFSHSSSHQTECSKLNGWDRLLSENFPRDFASMVARPDPKGGKAAGGIADPFDRADAAFLGQLSAEMSGALKGVQVLASLRGGPLIHGEVGNRVSAVGRNGENTVRLLASIQAKTNPDLRRLHKWASRFGLPGIDTAIDGPSVRVVFKDPSNGAALELGQAATGSQQCLTMATQIFLSPEGSTLLIEEPETNLHPGFERLLPELFCDAVKGGKQVITSTHSEVLVAALAEAVRRGRIKASEVAIWHLERGQKAVRAERVLIDERGYLAEWVKSFAAVEEELFDEWAKGLPEIGDAPDSGHARHSRGRKTSTHRK